LSAGAAETADAMLVVRNAHTIDSFMIASRSCYRNGGLGAFDADGRTVFPR
jgi:hypothetical protein